MDQWKALRTGRRGPRTELVYNINTALRFTAAIRLVGRFMALTAYIDISRYKDWKFIWGYPEGKLYYGLIIGANGFRLIINTIGQTQKLKTGELVFMIRRDFMK